MSVGFVLTIMVLTTEKKVFILEHYFRSYGVGSQNVPSLHNVRAHYEEQFNKMAPSNKTILAIVKKFHPMGSVLCQWKGTTGCPRTLLKLGLSDRSVRQMFKELGGFAYCIKVAQRLTETDERAWLQYCSWVLSMTYADPDFCSNIWFPDESHIHLNCYINRRTIRLLGFERPDVVVQKPLHSVHVMIWCAVSRHGILGPYFVEDDAQNPLTVNQECYREIIIAPFVRDLKCFCHARNLPRLQWMRQDGATVHKWGSRGITCLSATTLWWSLNFPWNGIPIPFTLPGSHGPRYLQMGHAERIHFPIRWPNWKCYWITGEYTVIFCVLTSTCVHQHV